MSMVFNYYTFGTSNIDDILYNLKDKLSENGWTIDYDKISSEGKLAIHIPDTECYYTISKSPNYQDPSGDNHFLPYTVSANRAVDTDTWWNPTLSYSNFGETYFVVTNSYGLINSKMCVLILEGYTETLPDYPYCSYYIFGQLEIPNENLQGNYLFITPIRQDSSNSSFGLYIGRAMKVYYQNTACSPADIEGNDHYLYGLIYQYYSTHDKYYPADNITSDYDVTNKLPGLPSQPYQFGRLYLRTLIVYHKYEQDSTTYIHPIGETPFYLCKYRGTEWYNKTLTYNTRKFKVYPLAGKGINYESEYGIAFEVGNL